MKRLEKVLDFINSYKGSASYLVLSMVMFFTLTGNMKEPSAKEKYTPVSIEEINKERINLQAFKDLYDKLKEIEESIPKEPTMEEKIEWIIENHNVTPEELDITAAGCVAECIGSGYDEGYAVASAIVNRLSHSWCVSAFGDTIYDQFIADDQFSVYASGLYKQYLGRTDLEEYQGAIDMFYSMEPSHNYLSFKSHNYDLNEDYEYMTEKGNKYHKPLQEEDRIENELVLSRAKD